MSTRAQIILREGNKELWFYRHNDGYPQTILPSLNKFLQWIREDKIRDNIIQASGWLVLLGRGELSYLSGLEPEVNAVGGWEAGAYQPCPPTEIYGIEYLYTIDLEKKKVTFIEV